MARPASATPTRLAAFIARLPRRSSPVRPDLEQELEDARRLGHWFTEEDRQLVREHEARLAAVQRGELMRKAGRGGALALMVASTVLPLLWPLAILAGIRAFPTASRRLGLALAISGGLGLITAGVLVLQLSRALLGPTDGVAPAPVAALSSREAGMDSGADLQADQLGRDLAARLERATDYWILEGRSPDGTATWRKGLYQQRDGRPVMVLPRSSWILLTPRERRALAAHLRAERDISAIHVGQLVPATGFEGNTIRVEERVWP